MRNLVGRVVLLMIVVTATACGGGARPSAAPLPAPRTAAERLVRALTLQTWSPEQMRVIDELDSARGADWVRDRMVAAMTDSLTPFEARINILLHLGRRRDTNAMRAFREGMRSSDATVRAAAMVGLGELMAVNTGLVLPLLRRGLEDPDELVQAKAMQSLVDADVDALRAYVARTKSAQHRKIATELVALAEERGAPLDTGAIAVGGELTRTTASGHTVRFRATRAWPAWRAAVGELWVTQAGGQPVRVADGVEVVGGVVPAFFSADGRYMVYEAARTIRVRDMQTGTDRTIGAGVAPRVLPFEQGFAYLVQDGPAADERTAQRLVYRVLRARFQGGDAEQIGTITARVSMSEHGAYSPVRWMRIQEREGAFYLTGDRMEGIRLPDPFGAGGS